MFEIADNARNRAAEKKADARQDERPNDAADRVEHQKSHIAHSADAVKQAHRRADAVDIFGNNQREVAEFIDQTFDARSRHFVKTIILDRFAKHPPDEISDVVADDAAERSRQKDAPETVFTEKIAVRHRARNQQGNVALNGAKHENGVDSVLFDELGKMFHKENRSLSRLCGRDSRKINFLAAFKSKKKGLCAGRTALIYYLLAKKTLTGNFLETAFEKRRNGYLYLPNAAFCRNVRRAQITFKSRLRSQRFSRKM